METLLEIIKLTVPPLIVFFTAYMLLKRFLDNDQKKQLVELKKMNRGNMTPVRMQAYERLVLYLERIHPNNLVMRTHKAGMSARMLHGEMVRNIREEFGHNMSQQIYISNGAWEMSKNSKEECIKLLNIALQNIDDTADGIKLGAVIFELCGKLDKLPSEVAIEYVKVEVQKLM
jgi:hypothetical protein